MRVMLLLGLFWGAGAPLWGQLTEEQHARLVRSAQWLAGNRIAYNERCQLPGETVPWSMDCSNTARYLYKKALGMDLPRVASGQYWTLSQEGKVWPAPRRPDGRVDVERLMPQLASGDLLFWEWTYDIKRTPPVSHVMVYLGRNQNGVPRMAGSSSRHGGGVGIYDFDPNEEMGGVKDFWGNWKHRARLVGYGRPLQAAAGETRLAAEAGRPVVPAH